jgi:hypothetical protein
VHVLTVQLLCAHFLLDIAYTCTPPLCLQAIAAQAQKQQQQQQAQKESSSDRQSSNGSGLQLPNFFRPGKSDDVSKTGTTEARYIHIHNLYVHIYAAVVQSATITACIKG